MILEKYSIGIGDRFAHQGKAQLNAIIKAKKIGINVVPVWNKSHREHTIIATTPASTRREADEAVANCKWTDSYYVDADHINMSNVDLFIDSSDFFTLDVADYISQKPTEEGLTQFMADNNKYIGSLEIDGIGETFNVTEDDLLKIGKKFLAAVTEAGKIYRHIAKAKGADNFITEVSMDESELPQSPAEMFFILSMIAAEKIPAQTIAPKFTGQFNKGVDYVGDVDQFEKEFNQDIAVIKFAVEKLNLPKNLKLSVHSGSDKFSIYEPINKALKKFGIGLHLKTAGTTWLEELIGLAVAGEEGLEIAKEVYKIAMTKKQELITPYATVVDIDEQKLPTDQEVNSWDGQVFANALRHDQSCDEYNMHFRQMLHLSYKIAAQMGDRFIDALKKHEDVIAENVTENLYERHIKKIFV